MYRNSLLKQTLFFVLGSFINLALFCLSKYAGFPVWCDYAGSLYITATCGIIMGFASTVLHTVIMIVLIDGAYALWFAIPALTLCGAVYLCKRRVGLLSPSGVGYCAFISAIVSFFSIWLSLGTIGAFGRRLSVAPILSDNFILCLAAAGTAFLETALTAIIFYIAYMLTPKSDEKLKFKR